MRRRLIKKGIHEGLDASGYPILANLTPSWAPPKAQEWASGQVTRFGAKIIGVVAANDAARQRHCCLQGSRHEPVPPVTGNDATTAALQLIISGDQYNTISSKARSLPLPLPMLPWRCSGRNPRLKPPCMTPSQLFVPAVVTAENIKAEIFDKGIARLPTSAPATMLLPAKLGIK